MISGKLIFILLIAFSSFTNAQINEKDSLLSVINKRNGDTAEVNALSYLANQQTEIDSISKYATAGLKLSESIDYPKGKADCYLVFARINLQNILTAIQYALDALNIFKANNDYPGIATANLLLQAISRDQIADYSNSLSFPFAGMQVAEKHNPRMYLWYRRHRILPLLFGEIAQTFVLMNKQDFALIYTLKCLDEKELYNGGEYEFGIYLLAYIQNIQGKYQDALKNYRKALLLAFQNGFFQDTLQIYSGMSSLFRNTGQLDSSIYYAKIVSQAWNNNTEYKIF